jgi:hypothetical protein
MYKYKLIGLYEIITGIFGFILVFLNIGWIHVHKENFNTFISGLALYAGSVFAGYALFKGFKNTKKYSVWLQSLQSFSFICKGYQYLFTGGAFLSIVYNSNGISIHCQATPIDYLIAQVSTYIHPEVKLFIIPICFLIILLLKRPGLNNS